MEGLHGKEYEGPTYLKMATEWRKMLIQFVELLVMSSRHPYLGHGTELSLPCGRRGPEDSFPALLVREDRRREIVAHVWEGRLIVPKKLSHPVVYLKSAMNKDL
jgi:hypothetical protein